MSSLLVFNRVYRLEVQSVMLVFTTSVVNYSTPLTFSLVHLPPSSPSLLNKYRGTCIHTVCYRGRGINTCRQVYRYWSILKKPQFRVWCLYRYFVHGLSKQCRKSVRKVPFIYIIGKQYLKKGKRFNRNATINNYGNHLVVSVLR